MKLEKFFYLFIAFCSICMNYIISIAVNISFALIQSEMMMQHYRLDLHLYSANLIFMSITVISLYFAFRTRNK